MAEATCAHCGHPNPLTGKFCSSCGAALTLAGQEHDTTVSVLVPLGGSAEELAAELAHITPGLGLLVVTRGPNSGSRFALDEPLITAGRHPDSTIFLDDITVSRRHAEVRQVENGYEVADSGSLNGTYLNRQRVESAPLTHGDEIQIGTFKLIFLTGLS